MTTHRSPTASMALGRRLFVALSGSLAILSLAFVPTVTHAQSAGQWRDPPQIFKNVCAYCHSTGIGPELQGRKLETGLTRHIVRYGGRAMPSFRETDFSDAELVALARWIEASPLPAQGGKP